MSRETQLQQFQQFLLKCTANAKSVKNYTDFKRIDECIGKLYPNKDISVLDINSVSELEKIISQLEALEEYKRLNNKGKNQYSNSLKQYLYFLYAKSLFEGYPNNNLSQPQNYTFEELAKILVQMNMKYGSYSFYLFGLQYGSFLNDINITKLVNEAGLTPSMSKELNKAKRLYEIIIQDSFTFPFGKYKKEVQESVEKNYNLPRQVIYFGAPGTGKSFWVEQITRQYKNAVIRKTFHPDSDYSTFVGCYKPTTKSAKIDFLSEEKLGEVLQRYHNITPYKYNRFGGRYWQSLKIIDEKGTGELMSFFVKYGGKESDLKEVKNGMAAAEDFMEHTNNSDITYNFIPQAFTKAYIRAWQTDEPVFLVIEEINRGNCAQIFGDLFQLLDRKNNISEYPIKPDHDLGSYINEQFKKHGCVAPEDSAIFKGEELCLPANLYIWATMNTSDQSLFPIDSAFKRRWEWRYIKIAKPTDKETGKPFDWHIEGGTDWWEFLKQINRIINKMTNSADKQLGYFFAKADDAGEIKYDRFVAKVCFYLWNDIFKTYAMDDVETDLFKFKYPDEEGLEKVGKLNFTEFFDENGKVVPGIVQQFIDNVMKWSE